MPTANVSSLSKSPYLQMGSSSKRHVQPNSVSSHASVPKFEAPDAVDMQPQQVVSQEEQKQAPVSRSHPIAIGYMNNLAPPFYYAPPPPGTSLPLVISSFPSYEIPAKSSHSQYHFGQCPQYPQQYHFYPTHYASAAEAYASAAASASAAAAVLHAHTWPYPTPQREHPSANPEHHSHHPTAKPRKDKEKEKILKTQPTKLTKRIERQARKNATARKRAAQLKETIARIKQKKPEERTAEEAAKLALFEERRLKKNNRTRERVMEKKTRESKIRNKPKEEWTEEEKEFMQGVLLTKTNKNLKDRLRRLTSKLAKEIMDDI